jgi:hypothetical protein
MEDFHLRGTLRIPMGNNVSPSRLIFSLKKFFQSGEPSDENASF